jgi:hypothetical protein
VFEAARLTEMRRTSAQDNHFRIAAELQVDDATICIGSKHLLSACADFRKRAVILAQQTPPASVREGRTGSEIPDALARTNGGRKSVGQSSDGWEKALCRSGANIIK